MQISRETKDAIAEAFAGFDLAETPKMTRAQAMMMELPYGVNPDYGRLGRKRVHFEPISLAFAAVFAGGASVAAIATVVSVIGTAMTVVGAITGNQMLMKIGGIMSLAGGVVSLASGALSGAAGASAAEMSAVDASMAGTGVEAGTGLTGAEIVGGTPDLTNFGATEGLAEGVGGVATEPGGLINSSMGSAPGEVIGSAAPVDAPTGMPQPQQTPTASGSTNPGETQIAKALTKGAGQSETDPGVFGWMKQKWDGLDKETRTGILNGVGGLYTGWTKEEEMEFNKHKQSFLEEQKRLENTNANSQPVWTQKKPVGLINSSTAPRAA